MTPNQSLSASLSQLPRVNKGTFLSSFVKEQQINAKIYAQQGPLESPTGGSLHSAPAKEMSRCGFDTPILKPRAAKTIALALSHNLTRESPEPPKRQRPKSPTKESQTTLGAPSTKKRSSNPTEPIPAKKQKVVEPSDDEHAARLTERRERRRAKRAIVRPSEKENSENEEISDNDDDDEVVVCDPKSKGKGKTKGEKTAKKDKVPRGLALMHGFNASNVGKHRLTSKLPVTLGVFNRGRASEKTSISKKKQDKKTPVHFSEDRFLNPDHLIKPKTTGNVTPAGDDADDDSRPNKSTKAVQKHGTGRRIVEPLSEISAEEEEEEEEKEKKPIKPKRKRKMDPSIVSSSLGSSPISAIPPLRVSRTPKHRDAAPKRQRLHSDKDETTFPPPQAQSEVWDIEKSDFHFPTKARPTPQDLQSSVILDTGPTRWASHILDAKGDCKSDVPNFDNPASEIHLSSSPSLGPSESASQHGKRTFHPAAPVISKYFTSLEPKIAEPRMSSPVLPKENRDVYASESLFVDDYDEHPSFSDHGVYDALDRPISEDGFYVTAQDEGLDVIDEAAKLIEDDFMDGAVNPWDVNENEAHEDFRHTGHYDEDDLPLCMDALWNNDMETFSWYGTDGQPIYADSYDYGDNPQWDNDEILDENMDDGHDLELNMQEGQEIWNTFVSDDNEDYDYRASDMEEPEMEPDMGDATLETSSAGSLAECSDSDDLGIHHFLGGRELLCGFGKDGQFKRSLRRPGTSAEAHVAKTIRGHWLPQRL